MGLATHTKKAPLIRPALNIGCLFDIPTGVYKFGEHGESILNGGLAHITGLGGRGNTYKTAISFYMFLQALLRYNCSEGQAYDTEITLSYDRLQQLLSSVASDADIEQWVDEGKFSLTDGTVYMGNVWFDALKEYLKKEKVKDVKKNTGTTPFVNAEGQKVTALKPTLAAIDSLSGLVTDSVDKIYHENEIGESGMNIEALKNAAAKSQMIVQLPALTGATGTYVLMTAHMGDDLDLDPWAPSQKQLTFLKNKVKFKHVPEKFHFHTNNCWYMASAQVFQNKTTKGPEYPRNKDDNATGDTDLQLITLLNLRGKGGASGIPFQLVVSQSEGVKIGLSEFQYLKNNNRFGIGGHDRSYFIELRPSVTLQRTTIRSKIEEDPLLKRALEISSEICQMYNYWHHIDRSILCTPSELYEDLKAKGYDWGVLLNTRGFWIFEEDEHPLPFLSTMDLLRMRKGLYVPYWYPKKKEGTKQQTSKETTPSEEQTE